nr:ERF family protein [uncultured Acetatifactor sp.]
MGESGRNMIYSAICGVMEDIGVVGKNDTNKQQGFKYRGIDSVMNALNPAMIKHKIFCVPEVLEQTREERTTAKGATLIYSVCKMRYRFYATDGSSVDAVVVGEGMDSGDKATNKAMSVAFKYACFQTFCIPTEDLMDDPDADSHENTKKVDKGTSQPNIDDERNRLLEELKGELVRTGYGWGAVTKTYKVDSIDNLTKLQIKDCIAKMKKQPDKAAS